MIQLEAVPSHLQYQDLHISYHFDFTLQIEKHSQKTPVFVFGHFKPDKDVDSLSF